MRIRQSERGHRLGHRSARSVRDPGFVSPPEAGDWTIIVRPPSPGGGQLPGFDLGGIVSNDTATAIIVEHGPTAEGPWTQAYQGPPTVTKIPIDGLQPGATYYVAIQYQRNQNYSARQVYGPYTAPALIGDVMPNAPGLSQIKADIEAAFGDIFDVSGLLADARADIDAQGVEIAAARGGQPSLNSRILELNQARIDGDTANAQAISLVQARTENTEADIIDLENALATETGSRAEAIQQVTARQAIRPNLLSNPTAASGMQGLSDFGPRVVMAYPNAPDGPQWSAAASGTGPEDFGARWAVFDAKENAAYSLQVEMAGFAQTGGQVRAVGLFQNSSGVTLGAIVAIHYGGDFALQKAENVISPAGTARIAFQIDTYQASFGLNGSAAWRRVKLEQGSICTLWTDDTSVVDLSASVTEQALAIIDLENNANLASWYVKTEASGGRPAVLGVFSSTYGNGIALGAEQVFLGDNTTIDTVSQTQQGIWGTTRRVIANGPPFGPDNLIHWAGPSDIALSAMTKANAGFWQDQNGSYGPTPVPLFWARVTPSVVTKTRLGAGSVATALNDVIVTCMGGTSGATCTWSRVSGDTSISHPNTGFTPTFSTTLTVGQIKTAVFAGLVIKGGETALVYLTVEFQETT